jgi:glycosyltransferase involved in cell wall biosynthesis
MRVDRWIATSSVVAQRIARFYGVQAPPVVPPPVDLEVFRSAAVSRGDSFVWAGRIVEPYKRVELLIEAFRQLPYRLLIAGRGRDELRLRQRAPANVVFLGELDSHALAELYGSARAVLFPSEDDFGMVPIEAMACGAPVVAFRGGGALDTVVDGETGVFFDEPSVSSLSQALERCLRSDWDEDAIVAHASGFGRNVFAARIRELLA